MNHLLPRAMGAALVLGLCLEHAQAAPGLTTVNFVDIGDSVSQVLDTSGLAFSTMMMGSAAMLPSPRNASFGAPAKFARPEKFKRACPGGGEVTIDVLDADAGGDLSVGDRFKIDFKSCVIEGDTVSGHSEFVVAAHRFEGMNEITELDFRFDALGSAKMRWTGTARAALRSDLRRGTESYVVTYRDLAVTRGSHAMRWSFSVDMVRPPIGNQLAGVKGTMIVDGLALQLRQDEPFVIAVDGHPSSGQLTASDKHGARLQIEALRRRYAYRLFRASNGGETPDAASESKPYGSR
ncbi:MAG: hypothetical protein V4569_00360 [Pseudomonadota bacterium]